MQLKTLLAGLLATGALMNIGTIKNEVITGQELAQHRNEKREERRELRENARQREQDSKDALKLAKTGCVRVVDQRTRTSTVINPGEKIIVPDGTNKGLSVGSLVCSQDGYLGIVGEDSTVETVYQITPEDMVEYLEYYYAMQTQSFRGLGDEN